MNERDTDLYARARNQLLRARDDARSRHDLKAEQRIDEQLRKSPYDRPEVLARSDQLLRPSQPITEPPTLLDRIRGKVRPSPSSGS